MTSQESRLLPLASSTEGDPPGERDSISVNPGSPPSPSLPQGEDVPSSKTNTRDEKSSHDGLQQAGGNDLATYETSASTAKNAEEAIDGEEEKGVEEKEQPKQEDEDRGGDEEEEQSEVNEKEPSPDPSRDTGSFIFDPAGSLTYDETTVDVVAVPCPGGHPLRTWTRDGLMGRYFGAPSMRDPEAAGESKDRPAPSWVRQGIRREADQARIMLYEHPSISDGTLKLGTGQGRAKATLSRMADALLEALYAARKADEDGMRRPLIFVGHSIGGLIVKMALVKAARNSRFEEILRQCYAVAFFGTPHQGSSYFAMPSLAASIQSLLQLEAALPTAITDDLRVGNHVLLHLDDDFKAIATDIRVWTLYETIDSRLSGSASQDVYFTAPLASIKSAILGMRQETILPLQGDHANIASFGRNNVHTLRLFLKQLASLIEDADENYHEEGPGTLNLEQKVNIEVHGFFEDAVIGPDGAHTSITRAWSTRLPLKEFLHKGPDRCLADRLNEVDSVPDEGRFLKARGRTSLIPEPVQRNTIGTITPNLVKNALGIKNESLPLSPPVIAAAFAAAASTSPPTSPILRPVDMDLRQRTESVPHTVLGVPMTPPSRPTSPLTHYSTPIRRPSPLIRADFDQDLAVDRLSPPPRGRMGRSLSRSLSAGSTASHYEYRDFPPFSQRSRSTFDGRFSDDGHDADVEASPPLPESVLAIRKVAKSGERRPSETVVVDEVPVAFLKPEVDARKFVWIHLPYNNPAWVTKVFETLQTTYGRNFSQLYNPDFWATRHTRGRHAQHYAYYAKPGCYFSAPRHRMTHGYSPRDVTRSPFSVSPRNSSVDRHHSQSPPRLGGDGAFTCLFLPYLHFDSYKRLLRRRQIIVERLRQGRSRPIPDSVSKTDSLECQVLWEFLGHDPPINSRRTLDQFGYPSLRDTRSRDDDQMLYKLTKERGCHPGAHPSLSGQGSSASYGSGSQKSRTTRDDTDAGEAGEWEDEVLNGNVLMVDQLWLWVIDSHTLVSFFPKREGDAIEGPLYQQADLRDSVFNEVNVDLTRQCENAMDLAALAALHAVSVLLDRASHPDLEVFRIFEEALSVLTEKLTSSMKMFRAEGFRDKATAYEPVENKIRSIRARHKEEGRRAEEENRDNTSALLELRDIEDELLILLHLFERQTKVISSMLSTYARPELRDRTTNGRVFLSEALKKVSEYAQTTQEMIQRVRNTREDYDKLLQMVQRQAQVDEVRLSRLHADLASAQSRSVMIFTTFTVIFLPLTFFTGLFGMNTREWGGGDFLTLKEIGAIALPGSVVLIAAALIIAWSTTARKLFRTLGKMYTRMTRRLYKTTCKPLADAVMTQVDRVRWRRNGGSVDLGGPGREDRDGRGARARGLESEASDFWERHQLQRERGYQVPEKNRRVVRRGRLSVRGRAAP